MKRKLIAVIVACAAGGCSSPSVDASDECQVYCDAMIENCPGTYEVDGRFDIDQCVLNCEGFPRRTFTNADGNEIPLGNPVPNSDTLECRTYHANNASAQKDGVHCTHASPEGGGVCTFQPECQRYCAGVGAPDSSFGGVVEACQGEAGAFADINDCADFCAGLPAGTAGDLDGNTANCRISWSEQLASDPDNRAEICANALPDSTVCVTR